MAGLQSEWSCTTERGEEHRKYSITWQDDELVKILFHLIVLKDGELVQENITPIVLPREAACVLFDMLGEALHNQAYWEEQSKKEQA